MKIRNKLFTGVLFSLLLVSCTDETLGPSIFDTTGSTLDSTSYTYAFDKFLYNNYLVPYNLEFAYKMKDVETDMDYNLVPASLENSEEIAVLCKYLWFDVYAQVVDSSFLKKYGPRMIHLIGSPAYNPANGTMILGLAEGGIKISMLNVNRINTSDPDMLNEYYFKTMHHEFAHILHQTKQYPVDFNLISYKNYDPYTWQKRTDQEAASLGFVSPYGSSANREDFVEIIANYIVKTDAQWNLVLDYAAKGWTITNSAVVETTDNDGVDGKSVIMKKLGICRTWLKDAWGVDLDSLRSTVQYRQSHIDMDSLMSQIN